MTTNEKIKKIRKERGLTQKQLGELCGIAESTIRRYELGDLNPKLDTIKKIAYALNVTISELFPDNWNDAFTNEVKKDFKKDLNKDEYYSIWTGDPSQIALNYRFKLLNKKGRQKALENIGDLTRIDLYTDQDQDK